MFYVGQTKSAARQKPPVFQGEILGYGVSGREEGGDEMKQASLTWTDDSHGCLSLWGAALADFVVTAHKWEDDSTWTVAVDEYVGLRPRKIGCMDTHAVRRNFAVFEETARKIVGAGLWDRFAG